MSDMIFDALQECLIALEQGQEGNEVLSRFPDLESDLRPILDAAEAARESARFDVPGDSMQRSRSRLLGHAAQLREERPARGWFGLPKAAAAILTVLFVLIIGSGGLVSASTQALPGDPLYSVKRAAETVSLSLALNERTKQSMKSEYIQRRKDEARALLILDRPESVTFEGYVQVIRTDYWIVDEIKVLVTKDTKIVGEIEPSMGVEVSGMVQPGGWVEAFSVKLRTYTLSGILESLKGDSWVVDGTRFRVDEFTFIEDEIEVGEPVVVFLRVADSGERIALDIREGDESPSRSEDESFSESEPQSSSEGEDEDEADSGHEEDEDVTVSPTPEKIDTPQAGTEQDEDDGPEEESEQDDDDESDDEPEQDETQEPEETDEPGD